MCLAGAFYFSSAGAAHSEAASAGSEAAASEAAWASAGSQRAVPLTRGQATRLFLVAAVPFVGFGIVDNGIMVWCGRGLLRGGKFTIE